MNLSERIHPSYCTQTPLPAYEHGRKAFGALHCSWTARGALVPSHILRVVAARTQGVRTPASHQSDERHRLLRLLHASPAINNAIHLLDGCLQLGCCFLVLGLLVHRCNSVHLPPPVRTVSVKLAGSISEFEINETGQRVLSRNKLTFLVGADEVECDISLDHSFS